MRLYATRYDHDSNPERFAGNIADIGIRWALPGGIQRFEVKIRTRSVSDSFWRFRLHHFNRMVIYDSACDIPIADGYIYEVIPDGNITTYVCAGAWQRFFEDLYTTDDMTSGSITASSTTDTVIKSIMTYATNSSYVQNTGFANIESTGLAIGGWTPDERVGTLAGDAINELAAMGDTSDNWLWFYLKSRPFNGIATQTPTPCLEAVQSSATVKWRVRAGDIIRDGASISRHAFDVKTDVAVGYGRLRGTHTSTGGAATQLTDSAASFITSGVTIGDTVVNITDGSYGQVSAVTSETVLTVHDLFGGTDNDFDTNDRYAIIMRNPQWTAASTYTAPTGAGWTVPPVKHREIRMEMDVTQAAQYRDTLLAQYKLPVKQQAFIIGSPYIRDSAGGRHPLWRPIAEGGGYMFLKDFYPEEAVLSTSFSYDVEQTFRIVAMDYTYANNRLRIVPESSDARLDVLLGQAMAKQKRLGQIISTARSATTTGTDGGKLTDAARGSGGRPKSKLTDNARGWGTGRNP